MIIIKIIPSFTEIIFLLTTASQEPAIFGVIKKSFGFFFFFPFVELVYFEER